MQEGGVVEVELTTTTTGLSAEQVRPQHPAPASKALQRPPNGRKGLSDRPVAPKPTRVGVWQAADEIRAAADENELIADAFILDCHVVRDCQPDRAMHDAGGGAGLADEVEKEAAAAAEEEMAETAAAERRRHGAAAHTRQVTLEYSSRERQRSRRAAEQQQVCNAAVAQRSKDLGTGLRSHCNGSMVIQPSRHVQRKWREEGDYPRGNFSRDICIRYAESGRFSDDGKARHC